MSISCTKIVDVPRQRDPSILNAAAGRALRAERFFNAGCFLNASGSLARFADGTTWSESKLYEKAIEVDAALAPAYFNLAQVLHEGQFANVAGRKWNAQMLYARTIELDPAEVEARVALACLLRPGDRVHLGGMLMDRYQLCISAIVIDPNYAEAYLQLGKLLAGTKSKVALPGGPLVGSEELLVKAKALKSELLVNHETSTTELAAADAASDTDTVAKAECKPSSTQTRYLPLCLNDVPVLVSLGDSDSNAYVVDNLLLKAATRGIGYRMSMDLKDVDPDDSMTANWGTVVRGQRRGDWLQVDVATPTVPSRTAAKGGC